MKKNIYSIAICGVDGCGKTTITKALYNYYKDKVNIGIAKVEFPSKKHFNLDSMNTIDDEDAIIKRVGMAFDFVQFYKKLNFNDGILICDRYDLCYKVLNRVDKLPTGIVKKLDLLYNTAFKVDQYILLDIDIDTASNRLKRRGNRKIDESDKILFEMRKYYFELIKHMKNVIIIDATKTIDEVVKNIIDIISKSDYMSDV